MRRRAEHGTALDPRQIPAELMTPATQPGQPASTLGGLSAPAGLPGLPAGRVASTFERLHEQDVRRQVAVELRGYIATVRAQLAEQIAREVESQPLCCTHCAVQVQNDAAVIRRLATEPVTKES